MIMKIRMNEIKLKLVMDIATHRKSKDAMTYH